MRLGTAHVIRANSRHLPLADNSVDLVVTSPPYFALRSYQDGGEHYAGQIGDEPTPDEFVSSLLEVTRECMRVLKPSGSLWVNLGDKYGPNKGLLGLPWRYANRVVNDLGLILRAEVIWSKPNGLPESVTDRVRRSHEQWFHFTLQPRYFSAVDEIREPVGDYTGRGSGPSGGNREALNIGRTEYVGVFTANPLGKLPGSVWTVPTEPLRVPDHLGVDHFAAFPTEWPKRIIEGWSPAGVCVECGEGRRPAIERDEIDPRHLASNSRQDDHERLSVRGVSASSILRTGLQSGQAPATRITGYACACGTFPESMRDGLIKPPTRPAVVLDPFGGTGTTAMVAKALGRHGISVDMSADYCRLAEWRTNDRDQLAKVLGIAKAEPIHADEASLLDLLGEGE